MPMTLWSVEKIYFRTNDNSGWVSCAPAFGWTATPSILYSALLQLGLFGLLFGQPRVEFLLRVNDDVAAHAVMAESAKLGAGDFKGSRHDRLEPDADPHARRGVLLCAEGRDVETVDDG